MTNFREYANYYDLLYKDKDYDSEVRYIDGLIRQYHPGVHSILELGCGTGTHAFLMADEGYSLQCVDTSERMLDIARNRLGTISPEIASRIEFNQGDIRSYQSDRKFDAVIALFHVVSYQTSNEDLIATFRTAASHLKKGGIFIFDCWYGPAVLTEKPGNRTKSVEDDRLLIERISTPVMWPNENIVDVNFDVKITDKLSDTYETVHELHRMRYLFSPEISFYLQECGFRLESSEEWLTGETPDTGTWNVCYIARA